MRYVSLLTGPLPEGPPPPGLMEGIMTLGAEAEAAGAMIENQGLTPSIAGARVTLDGGAISVTDGPFAEAKEFISYAVWETRNREEAVEWSRRFLQLHADHWPGFEGVIEIRKVMGPEDFA